jgi:8-oxo-dGTP pyrophosphatase MutT (NUDIX family)
MIAFMPFIKKLNIMRYILIISFLGASLYASPLQGEKSFQSHCQLLLSLDQNFEKSSGIPTCGDPKLYQQKNTLLPHLRDGKLLPAYHLKTVKHNRAHKLEQNSNNLSDLLAEAESTRERLLEFLTDFAKKYPGSTVLVPSVKGNETIQNLLKTRWHGDASRITDYARSTIAFETVQELYKALEELKQSHLIILEIKDNFKNPTNAGYRDINLTVRDFVNGHIAEIQLNIKSILDYKNTQGHKLFERIRHLEAIPILYKRDLTQEEKQELTDKLEQSNQGYKSALEKGTKKLNNFRIGAYLLIENRNGEILLMATKAGPRNILNFPGGGVDLGESIPLALRREIKEELNCDCQLQMPIYITQGFHVNPDFPHSQLIYIYYKPDSIDFNTKNLKNLEAKGEIVWVNLEKLPLEKMLPVDIEFINFLKTSKSREVH